MTLPALLIAVVLLLSVERLIRRQRCMALGSRVCQGLKWRREIRNTATRRVSMLAARCLEAYRLGRTRVPEGTP